MQHTLRFGSVSELLRYLDRTPINRENIASKYYSDRYYGGYEWDYGIGLAGAKQLAERGWSEGAKQIAMLSAPIVRRISSRILRPEPAFDIEGSAIDMGRYLQGEPECFLQWRESETEDSNRSGGIVHIVVNVAVSARFTSQQFYEKGAAVAVLVDCLEHSGKRVVLDVGGGANHPEADINTEVIVRLKEAQEPLSIESIAFAIAHPGFCRRLLFWARATQPGIYVPSMPHDLTVEGDINIAASKLWKTQNPAEWAMAELKKQGIEFSAE